MEKTQIKGIRINGIEYDLNLSNSSFLTSPNKTDYQLKVNNEGEIYTYNEDVDPLTIPSTAATTSLSGYPTYKLYINSFYCGGSGMTEHSVNYCSHNFVELANITPVDINLSGMSLQYSNAVGVWYILPLQGIIKAGSTFLIRGAQSAAINSPTTKIVIDDYDMEWRINDDKTYSPTGNPIYFVEDCASFYLTFGSYTASGSPFYVDTQSSKQTAIAGYIDLVGVNGTSNAPYYETKAYSGGVLHEKLFKKYYAMDPVSQATKDLDTRDNTKWWNYVDLTKENGEIIPSITDFTPKSVKDKKDIFYNKTKLYLDKPSMITCCFGIQATDDGSGATRCFNWLSRNLKYEYLWYRKEYIDESGETVYTDWTRVEQISGETDNVRLHYNPKIKEYSDKIVIVAHKCIVKGLIAGTYTYVAGLSNPDGTPDFVHCTPEHKFTVRAKSEVSLTNGFSFVQTSDQQGFNWDEYRIWDASCKVIEKEFSGTPIQFMINTGDMTQNGNRIGEWLDYFNGKNDFMNNMEEMATIGNNDLSPLKLYELGDGKEVTKLSLENIEFFYTFEMDENNPPIFTIGDNSIYIQSLYSFNYGDVHFMCVNSEITARLEESLGDRDKQLYVKIKQWCENDIENNGFIGNTSGNGWNIAYCHEMPFTILTKVLTDEALKNGVTSFDDKEPWNGGEGRNNGNGSKLNTLMPTDPEKYWFSDFCQTHNIQLVIGGHKHTQSITYPLLENVFYVNGERRVRSCRPIIVVNQDNIEEFGGGNTLVEINDGRLYPSGWTTINDSGETVISETYRPKSVLCEFMPETGITSSSTCPVVYAMSQATSYKHTSNKELPSFLTPWARYYYPCTNAGGVNSAQKFPFFTVWTIKKNEIIGFVRKVNGAFNGSGKFDINIDGPYVKEGKSAIAGKHQEDIVSINGLSSTIASGSTQTLIINRYNS